MRNWNIREIIIWIVRFWSLSRTYEELKRNIARGNRKIRKKFIAYLWGIETDWFITCYYCYFEFIAYLWGIETNLSKYSFDKWYYVYRVPMRNWNFQFDKEEVQQNLMFIAYLWGIETIALARFFILENKVYRVPMRNWNSDIVGYFGCGKRVYRVPMRNWNFLFQSFHE